MQSLSESGWFLNEWTRETVILDKSSSRLFFCTLTSHSADMWEWQISSLIGFISLVLFLVAVCYILYSGLTTEVHIRTGLPPVRSITIAYKYKVGPYKESGSLFRESCSIGPKLPCIGIFYDDPKKVSRPLNEWGHWCTLMLCQEDIVL